MGRARVAPSTDADGMARAGGPDLQRVGISYKFGCLYANRGVVYGRPGMIAWSRPTSVRDVAARPPPPPRNGVPTAARLRPPLRSKQAGAAVWDSHLNHPAPAAVPPFSP